MTTTLGHPNNLVYNLRTVRSIHLCGGPACGGRKMLGWRLKMQPLWWRVLLMAALALQSKDLCCLGEGVEPQVPALFVFGDSTVDIGMNTYMTTILKADFAPYGENFEGGKPTGRFTNGLMVNDFLALKLGLPLNLPYLDPNTEGERMLTGVNFASGGSGYLESTSRILGVLPAFEQLKLFQNCRAKMANLVGQDKAASIVSQGIFVISAGSNDFILNYLVNPITQQQYTVTGWADFVASNQTQFVKQLYAAGARNMVIIGFPPIGCLPAERTISGLQGKESCAEDLNKIATEYNNRLKATILQLQSTLPGTRLLYGDVFSYIYEGFRNPSQYGYTEVGRGCCGEGLLSTTVFCNSASEGTCSDPSTYMFFDSLHPTEKCYKAIAEQLYTEMAPFFGLKSN